MTVQVRSSRAVWGLATAEEMWAPSDEPTLGATDAAGKIPVWVVPSSVTVPLHGLVTAAAAAIGYRVGSMLSMATDSTPRAGTKRRIGTAAAGAPARVGSSLAPPTPVIG